MRYAQLNPKGLVLNVLTSEHPESPDFAPGAHFTHEEMWLHQAEASEGRAAPLIALRDEQRPTPGQRWNGQAFVDDAEWLQGRADQFTYEAEEQGRSLRLAQKDLKAAQADPDLAQDLPYYERVVAAAQARVDDAKARAADHAARAKAAKSSKGARP